MLGAGMVDFAHTLHGNALCVLCCYCCAKMCATSSLCRHCVLSGDKDVSQRLAAQGFRAHSCASRLVSEAVADCCQACSVCMKPSAARLGSTFTQATALLSRTAPPPHTTCRRYSSSSAFADKAPHLLSALQGLLLYLHPQGRLLWRQHILQDSSHHSEGCRGGPAEGAAPTKPRVRCSTACGSSSSSWCWWSRRRADTMASRHCVPRS